MHLELSRRVVGKHKLKVMVNENAETSPTSLVNEIQEADEY